MSSKQKEAKAQSAQLAADESKHIIFAAGENAIPAKITPTITDDDTLDEISGELIKNAETAIGKQDIHLAAIQPTLPTITPKFSIQLNADQLRAANYAQDGVEFCLIGAAGTGKTTSTKASVFNIMQKVMQEKGLAEGANLSSYIALVSFTNRAVRNIAKAVEEIGAKNLCRTIHKLLEYAPEKYNYTDDAGMLKEGRRFAPQRTKESPLASMLLVVVEEASMVDTKLFKELKDACPNAKFIFIGDLNQLPPVFGDAILGFKLAELPVIELTQVYRQAMESPIIAFQHNYTLAGRIPSDTDLDKITAQKSGLTFHPLKKFIKEPEVMCTAFGQFFHSKFVKGEWNPLEDIILIPYNKSVGTQLLNKEIAQLLGDDRQAEVYEVLAGQELHYYAVGDFVVWDRREWLIEEIKYNGRFIGKPPRPHSTDLTRYGVYRNNASIGNMLDAALQDQADSFEDIMQAAWGGEDISEIENQASHNIHLREVGTNYEQVINTRGDINKLSFGYAITIHKSQGSEWRKVYLIMTKHHTTMLSRELVYTGMTRAKEELFVIYSPQSGAGKKDSSVQRALLRQVIPGVGWKNKVEHFKGKQAQYNATMADEEDED
jgi:exodeoxyribonuclease V alpha subunit